MHLLVIGINYAPEQTSVAPFTTGLCEHLVKQGHHVSVITAFPYYPQWRIQDRYRGLVYKHEIINGVNVRRVIHFVPSKPRNLVQRLIHDISFSFNAFLAIPLIGAFDGIYCSCPPPFVPTIAFLASRMRGVPYAIKLTDLASEAATSLRIMQNKGKLAKLARKIEMFNYKHATGISVLCPAFKENLIRNGVPEKKISIVPDWADTKAIHPLPCENGFRRRTGISKDRYVALHIGNMGLKQGLDTVVEAAKISEASSNGILWLLVGDGEERRRLEQLAAGYNLLTLRFLPLQPSGAFLEVLASADVLILSQRANITDTVIPSKLLTYMAAGRPIIASVNSVSETARRIREAECGLIVEPENPLALVEAIQDLRGASAKAKCLGANGRSYVEQYFSKEAILKHYAHFMNNVFHFL